LKKIRFRVSLWSGFIVDEKEALFFLMVDACLAEIMNNIISLLGAC